MRTLQPPGWPRPRGYANGVAAEGGTLVFVAGQIGWYVTDREEYLATAREIGAAYRELMGGHYPAMAVVEVSALLEAQAKVEIEATAVVP